MSEPPIISYTPSPHSDSSQTTNPYASQEGGSTEDRGEPSGAGAGIGELEFVDWVPGSEEQDKKKKVAPRLHHKKSRLGCQQCRGRHVKCNEVHPTCGSCQRHGVICVWGRTSQSYPQQNPSVERSKPFSAQAKPPDLLPKPTPSTTPAILLENTERRLLELRLLHQYMAITYLTINIPGEANVKEWSISIPRLAFKHNSLLYSIYALSALHLSREDPSFSAACEQYLALTLSLHREDVKNLSASNADAACLTASHLRICTFASLQSRSLQPYTPPLDWLTMNALTGKGLQVSAWRFIKNDPESINRRMVLNAPGLRPDVELLRDEEHLFEPKNREKFLYLLHRTAEDEETEPWSEIESSSYQMTVSCLGVIQHAIDGGENRAHLVRRMILFPMTIGVEFVDLLKAMRPRALAILAHYFAILRDFDDFWWIGDTGKKEMNAIQSVLPERWRGSLALSEGCWFSTLKTLDLHGNA